MSDSVSVVIYDEESTTDGVVVYLHWGGEDVAGLLAHALERARVRWDDPLYLTRVLVCDLVAGLGTSLTGAGLSSTASPPVFTDRPSVSVYTSPRKGGQRVIAESGSYTYGEWVDAHTPGAGAAHTTSDL